MALVGLALAAGCGMALPAGAAEELGREYPVLTADAGQQQNHQAQQRQTASVSRLFDDLEMTPEQRSSCQAIVKQSWEYNRELRRQARETWHELMAALRRPGVTLDEAVSKQRQLARLQESLAEKRLETWFAVRKILTAQQLDRLSSLHLDSTLWFEDDNGEPRNAKRRNDVP